MATLLTDAPLDGAERTSAPSRVPEPVRLYALICLALLVHRPCVAQPGTYCARCEQLWPCPQVRPAYRLRESF